MRPFLSLNAGEYLATAHIEREFRKAQVWMPSRDTGVDLLVSDRRRRHTVALQVKYSKDFLVTSRPGRFGPEYQKHLRACGWWTVDRTKLRDSTADYWIFVLQGFAARSEDYVIVPQGVLWRRLRGRTPTKQKVHVFLWVTEEEQCWDTRALSRDDELRIVSGDFHNAQSDYTEWLNNWKPIAQLNR